MTTIEVTGIECDSAGDALGWVDASGGGAIRIGGKVLYVAEAEAHRLKALGVEFAYLTDYEMSDGSHRIMTVPVND